MDNHHFPRLEPDDAFPESLPEIPQQMEPLEDIPVIEEPVFDENTTSPVEEIPVIDKALPDPELPAEELPSPGEITPAEETPAVDILSVPEATPEITTEFQEEDFSEMPAQYGDVIPADPDHPEDPLQEELILQMLEEVPDQEYRDNGQEFDTIFQAPVPKQNSDQPAAAQESVKGRPKKKKGEGLFGIPSILATFVWLALIVVIGVTAGRMLWICAADVLAFGREDKVVTITVYEADTMDDIIGKLHDGGLIRYKSLFSLYAGISDAEEDIKPGIYDLNTRYDYHALVNFMSPRSSREVIKLTIPEGYTCRQIFALLEENRICTAVDAAAYAANGELADYWFLKGLERGTENCLEGYLFPDTYEFYKNSTPREAIERMLDNFEYRFNEEMIAQLDTINDKFRADYGVREIVIIASLIEKESAAPGESPKVSGVIYNRLFNWGNNRPFLNIDASIVYAQEGQNERIDTQLDHPYNTYLYEGLTPGPIANPGLASLKAALNPESHNYYYYVLNPATGMHQFSTTYQEHQGYVREFNAAPEIEIE